MARFDKPWMDNVRGATLSVKAPEPETLFRALAASLGQMGRPSTGVSRQNRQRLVSLLDQIPCLDNVDSGETESQLWYVGFDLDLSSPIAWKVVRKLGLLINTDGSSQQFLVVFMPLPLPGVTETMRWEITSTAPGQDPADVARWLRENFPQGFDEEAAWLAES
jgi:hypothetical protein